MAHVGVAHVSTRALSPFPTTYLAGAASDLLHGACWHHCNVKPQARMPVAPDRDSGHPCLSPTVHRSRRTSWLSRRCLPTSPYESGCLPSRGAAVSALRARRARESRKPGRKAAALYVFDQIVHVLPESLGSTDTLDIDQYQQKAVADPVVTWTAASAPESAPARMSPIRPSPYPLCSAIGNKAPGGGP